MSSELLSKIDRSKREFDVVNEKDRDEFKHFLKTGKWGTTGCPFVLEFPYLSVPDMIKDKIVKFYLEIGE